LEPTLLFLFTLLGCPAAPESVTLDVSLFDCDALCWNDGSLEVPGEHWAAWADGSACDDGGLYLTHGDACVETRKICESTWADDPAVGDASGCCGGGLDPEVITGAPGCADVSR
jgi:hypothetical protein